MPRATSQGVPLQERGVREYHGLIPLRLLPRLCARPTAGKVHTAEDELRPQTQSPRQRNKKTLAHSFLGQPDARRDCASNDNIENIFCNFWKDINLILWKCAGGEKMPYFTVKYLWLVELSFPICFFLNICWLFFKKKLQARFTTLNVWWLFWPQSSRRLNQRRRHHLQKIWLGSHIAIWTKRRIKDSGNVNMRAREEAIGCLNECTVGLVGTWWQQHWSHNYGLDCDVDINKGNEPTSRYPAWRCIGPSKSFAQKIR